MRIALLVALSLLVACNSGRDEPGSTDDAAAAETAAESEGSVEEAAADPPTPPTPVRPSQGSIAAQHEAQQQGAPVDPLPLPAGECTGVTPANPAQAPVAGVAIEAPHALGASCPTWILQDVQPRSCGHMSHYGLDAFEGPTLVVLLSAGCGYCLGQAAKLDELWWSFRAEDRDVNIVIVNQTGQEARLPSLLERTGLPIFQDVAAVNAWQNMDGAKDDFYFYDAEGTLVAYFSSHGVVDTTLATERGYENIRTGLRFLLGDEVVLPNGGHSPHTHHHPR